MSRKIRMLKTDRAAVDERGVSIKPFFGGQYYVVGSDIPVHIANIFVARGTAKYIDERPVKDAGPAPEDKMIHDAPENKKAKSIPRVRRVRKNKS